MPLPLPRTPHAEKEEKVGGEMEQRENQAPSPAPSNSHGIPDGFQQLIDHNNNEPTTSSYPPIPQEHQQQQQQAPLPTVDMYGQINSNPQSGYSSPAPQYQQPDMSIYDPAAHHELSMPYPPPLSAYQTGYAVDQSSYPPPPDTVVATPHHSYSTPATSPPTPLQQQSDAMRTRSGKAIRTSQAPGGSRSYRADPYPKPSPTAKTKGGSSAKKKKNKAGASKEDDSEFILDAPLSVLCADMVGVHEIDIKEYAERGVLERRAEVLRSKDGRTKRPSNAFMLYRKAFQNRAKELKKHDNHQVVSKICGSSWKRETPEVKLSFNALARVESELHREAFPEYKFSPAKSQKGRKPAAGGGSKGGAGAGRGAAGDRDAPFDGDNSDVELDMDLDFADHQPPSRAASRAGARYDPHHPDADYIPPGGVSYPPPPEAYLLHHQHHSPHIQQHQQQQQQQQQHHHHQRIPSAYQSPPPQSMLLSPQQQHHMSSYEYSNPGRPRPQPYGTLAATAQGGYLQKTAEMAAQMYPQHYGGNGNGNGNGGMAGMSSYAAAMAGVPARVENVYLHRTDPPATATAMQHGAGDRYGGIMGPIYGQPMHHHHHHQQQQQQQHGLPLPQQQHQQSLLHQHQHQHQHHHHQNIDPSLMPLHAPQQQQDEIVGGGVDPYDGPLGIYGAEGVDDDPLQAYPLGGGGPPDPIYQPTPGTPSSYYGGGGDQHHPQPNPYHHHHHQQQHHQHQHQQQPGHEDIGGGGGGRGGENNNDGGDDDGSDLWKMAPTSLDDPFDFDLLDPGTPDVGDENGGHDGAGDADGGAAGDDGSGGAANDGSVT